MDMTSKSKTYLTAGGHTTF